MSVCKKSIAAAAAALCFGALTPVQAATDAPTSAKARYDQERAACLNGTSHQDRATCLQEAGAALHESRRGGLTNSAQRDANATARCNALPEADRADCRSRVMNDTNSKTSGTVEGGGVIKETTTRYVMTPDGEKKLP